MKNYNVTFEIFRGSNHKAIETVTVEAGTKKMAVMRAMGLINKNESYKNLFKNLIKVEEIA